MIKYVIHRVGFDSLNTTKIKFMKLFLGLLSIVISVIIFLFYFFISDENGEKNMEEYDHREDYDED